MRKTGFTVLVLAFFVFVFFSQLSLIHHPVSDNDEGVYATSFLLMDKGLPAYNQTFFSQPPGFILSVFPGFVFLGKTLEAARLTIGLWTLLGLAGLIWVGFELKNKWIGLFTALLLYLIPTYYNQTLILQSDILVPVFSTLSLATLLRFLNTKNERWFYLSVILMTSGFWVKFDLSLIPVAMLILLNGFKKINRAKIFKKGILSTILAILFSLLIVVPFGIRDVIANVVTLRLQAVSQTQSPFIILEYLIKEPILFAFMLGSIFLLLVNLKRLNFITVILLVWNISFLLLLSFYHPLFPHHLSMITVPVVLLFSHLLFNLIGKKQRLIYSLISFVFIVAVCVRLYTIAKTPSTLIETDQRTALKIINSYTKPEDLIVTDEEILNVLSGRLPPPQLSDVSYVRIQSGNLSSVKFQQIVAAYRPKLIIPWNGRLASIQNFTQVLDQYQPLITLQNAKTIYIRK